jgi:glycine dehydrogenase
MATILMGSTMTLIAKTPSAPLAESAATVPLEPIDTFVRRHIGPGPSEVTEMLSSLGHSTMEDLLAATIPASLRTERPLILTDPTNHHGYAQRGEAETLAALRELANRNQVWRSYIGMGYSGCIVPGVILRNVLENPGWYTQYTPYQAEVAQGRLEALLNFQTMVTELTGLPVANASLLDEGTAAAEAMTMCLGIAGGTPHESGAQRRTFFVAEHCHPQTIAVIETRAAGLGVDVAIGNPFTFDFASVPLCGALLAYPTTDGTLHDLRDVTARVHAVGGQVVAACDLLALTLFTPPGEWGADIAVGSAQRFGVPMGFGGPHAAFMATRPEHVRRMPGRLIGVSRDAHGAPALRLAIQTREQHIKRDRATSNICTAQVLLAIMAGLYGTYHGSDGLARIARRIRTATQVLASALKVLGHDAGTHERFDTLRVRLSGPHTADVMAALARRRINVRTYADGSIGVSLDETVEMSDLTDLVEAFATGTGRSVPDLAAIASGIDGAVEGSLARTSAFMSQTVFSAHHSETDLLRYIKRLESRDLSLCHSMIPLGSCTMKLNSTSEMIPVTWPEFGAIHPFAPADQWAGYATMCSQLESWLCEITGFAACSLQPNAGSQGEYAGLMTIRAYHRHRGDAARDVCLIPESAHGTNPASAVVAGMRVVPVACDDHGNVDLADLRAKAQQHSHELAACMVTYPSTHGVFEEGITAICETIHANGGLVYLDGANMNAMVGLVKPGEIGADVCHLNLHKTFCIPHGGGGPGMGPICCTASLAEFLPGHPVLRPASAGRHAIGPISAAPLGSASILLISWMYIAMMGGRGLTDATSVAILNANYMAKRLSGHYTVLYTNANGRCAHEFILDCRAFDRTAGIKIDDIAKRLMDYGFHAPTMAWPVPGTLMIEPTESESKAECDRLCDALIAIREEIRVIEEGRMPRDDNPLKHAPHTAAAVTADTWDHAYTREQAAWPAPWTRQWKFWPAVGRVDNPYGDRNLVCTCDSVSTYS